MVCEWIGIHGQHHATHVRTFVSGNVRNIDTIELTLDILVETALIIGSIFTCKTIGRINLIVCDIVTGINLIPAMDRAIDQSTGMMNYLSTVSSLETGKIVVDTLAYAEMYPALIAKKTCLHAEKIVALRFLEIRIAAF